MKCKYCGMETTDKETKSCIYPIIVYKGKEYKRDTTHFDDNERCHDCGIENKEGNIHHFGCDMERCPRCGGQLISCGCFEEDFYFSLRSR